MKKFPTSTISIYATSLLAFASSAASNAQVCEAPSLANYQLNLPSNAPKDLGSDEVWVDANQVDGDKTKITARGNAYLVRGENIVTGDEVFYDRINGTARTSNSIIAQNGLVTKSKNASYGGKKFASELSGVDYFIRANGAHGTADNITSEAGNSTFDATNITYTTCNASNPTWWIEANKLSLNQDTNRGVARNAVVKVKGVPIFYSPYLPFFTNGQRATGLLTPKIAYSIDNGYTYIQPIYLNLAPNYDATLNLGNISNHGYFTGQEFRFLTQHNHVELTNQQLFYRDDRDTAYMRRWTHQYQNSDLLDGTLGQLTFTGEYNKASDIDVFDQVETSLYAADTAHLRQAAALTWSRSLGNAQIQLNTEYRRYQSLDSPQTSPYAYRPKTTLRANGSLPVTLAGAPVEWSLESAWTQLRHPTKARANRLINKAGLTHSIRKPYAFLNTKISFKQVNISLAEANNDNNSYNFSAPTLELDSGITLEKKFSNGMSHEFSPQLYYSYTPYKDQTDSPSLEAGSVGESISSLFQSSRFTGDERIADTNKISVSLENRIYNQKGNEIFGIKVAQSFYQSSPQINLNGSSTDKELKRSGAYLQARASITKQIKADMAALFNRDDYKLESYSAGLSLHDTHSAMRLGFNDNKSKDDDKSVYLSGKLALTKEISLLALLQYNIDKQSSNEHIVGLEYKNCCSAIRFGARNEREEFDKEFKRRYLLEFELGELGGVAAGQQFTDRIFGF